MIRLEYFVIIFYSYFSWFSGKFNYERKSNIILFAMNVYKKLFNILDIQHSMHTRGKKLWKWIYNNKLSRRYSSGYFFEYWTVSACFLCYSSLKLLSTYKPPQLTYLELFHSESKTPPYFVLHTFCLLMNDCSIQIQKRFHCSLMKEFDCYIHLLYNVIECI